MIVWYKSKGMYRAYKYATDRVTERASGSFSFSADTTHRANEKKKKKKKFHSVHAFLTINRIFFSSSSFVLLLPPRSCATTISEKFVSNAYSDNDEHTE